MVASTPSRFKVETVYRYKVPDTAALSSISLQRDRLVSSLHLWTIQSRLLMSPLLLSSKLGIPPMAFLSLSYPCRPSSSASASLPKAISADANGTAYVVTNKMIQMIEAGKASNSIPLDFEPTAATSYSTTKALLAVGGEDSKVRLYQGSELIKTLENNRNPISALAFSPDGQWLAVGESNGKILLYATSDWSVKTSQWAFHTARISTLAFSEDSLFCLSGSLDTFIYVWSVVRPIKKLTIKVRIFALDG